MKTLQLTLILLLLSTAVLVAQEKQEVYCQVVATAKLLNPNKINISIDYGEHQSIWKDDRLKDEETGKVKSFNSIVDALNYMGEQGWKLAQAYTVTMSGQNASHYLFKKEIDTVGQ